MSSLVDTSGDPGTIDPSGMQTEDAALLLYNGAILPFYLGFGGQCHGFGCYNIVSGVLSDELTTGKYETSSGPVTPCTDCTTELDERAIPEDQTLRTQTVEDFYRDLNLARNQAEDAIYALKTYAPRQPKDLIGHMYVIRGMVLVYLADIFCSGIPLTDYRSPGGYTYKPGSSTEDVYTAAIAQFDTALSLTPDSLNFHYFAQVGKARALLNLGKFADAATAVQGVPTNFTYKALYGTRTFTPNFATPIQYYQSPEDNFGTVADREGGNGLPFVSAHDPRVPLLVSPKQNTSYPNTKYMLPAQYFPTTSPWNGLSHFAFGAEPIVMANGIEARLTEAEAQVNAGDASWLTTLNTLRTTGTYTGVDTVAVTDTTLDGDGNITQIDTVSYNYDTLWVAGTGGVAGLGPLHDPGTKNARIKMVYNERGYWLYLTGHRQGDLRRLVRVYKWPESQVYPTGYYPIGDRQSYGSYTNIPVPYTEQAINPQYKGCINRDA
jgi:hypothetical protein